MTNLDYLDFQQYVKEKVTDFSQIKKTISIALGLAIARQMPIPTSCVQHSEDHFSQFVLPAILLKSSEFNEQLVVDIDLVVDVARGWWLTRYAYAHPTELIFISSDKPGIFASKLAGTTQYFNEAEYDLCNKNPELMIVLINRITQLFNNEGK